MQTNKPLYYWAVGWRLIISTVGALTLIALALNQVAGLGFRYGKAAGYNEAARYCQQKSIETQQEDVTWRTRESL